MAEASELDDPRLMNYADPPPAWLPIESAPRDGTEIIGIFFRKWDEDSKPTIYGPWTVAFDGKKWRSSWDGHEVIEYMDDFGTQYKGPDIEPTHWQPMPALPTA